MIIHVNEKELALLEIGLSDNVIKTEDDVEDLLNIFDEIKCCEGVTPSKALLNKISVFSQNIIESDGLWRHKNCSTILKDDDG